jgi:adenine-specific DNA methylase
MKSVGSASRVVIKGYLSGPHDRSVATLSVLSFHSQIANKMLREFVTPRSTTQSTNRTAPDSPSAKHSHHGKNRHRLLQNIQLGKAILAFRFGKMILRVNSK